MHGDFVRFVRVLIVAQVSNQRQEVGFTLTLIAFSVSDRAGASNSRVGAERWFEEVRAENGGFLHWWDG